MHTIEVGAGEHISNAARRLCAAAARHGSAVLKFNDITLTTKSGDDPDGVVSDFHKQSHERHVAWINSPEGKASAARDEAEIAALQERHDCLMRDLETMDFRDDVAVLDWLCAMQEPSDRTGVQTNRSAIVAEFSRHGFAPNVNTGSDYREDDRENSFRYLVGQALSTLQACAIHGILHKFVGQWKERFTGAH